jgi:hypothetical protein
VRDIASVTVDDGADRAEPEDDEHPVGDAGGGLARDHLLHHVQRHVGQHGAGAGEEALGQEAAGDLDLAQPIGDQRPVGLHRGVVAGIDQPEAEDGHPQRGDQREERRMITISKLPPRT